MDRRQQKTREAIFEAFGSLLSAKRYSKITIQEIIEKANVGRSTFYAHFETKDDLLKEMCTELFEHIFSKSLDMETTHDFSLTAKDSSSMLTHILYHLRDNKRNIIGLLNSESNELFLFYFKQYLNELITSSMLDGVEEEKAAIPYDFLVEHISGSFVVLVQWWIKNKMRQSPEEISGYFEAVIAPVLPQFYG
ncbi:TetR/AcrR family transcriptional regulator [Konateibacter massiliensis]|uniref:TetR/AcrR family transcriptional regulator n=1 Tax=Konateibacter massiliensis TaxID=2002841 RepID=UPI000C148CA7|nr:TetR/AcrR family transcriptional regulator [Konateibacter massiliensis]